MFDDVTYLCTPRNTALLMYDRQHDIDATQYGGRVVLTMRNINSRVYVFDTVDRNGVDPNTTMTAYNKAESSVAVRDDQRDMARTVT